jgi:hypothetical protein
MESQFVTSESDLNTYLKQCSKCYKLTKNGTSIFSISSLHLLDINKVRTKKFALILNTKEKSDLGSIGHWISVLVVKATRKIFIADSLTVANNNTETSYRKLHEFCKQNGFKLYFFPVQTQTSQSNTCGFQTLFWIHVFHTMNLSQILTLRHPFYRFSVRNLQAFILTEVYKRLFKKYSYVK